MAIEAELADGRILEFPDGTDPKVIQSTVKRLMGQGETTLGGQAKELVKGVIPGGIGLLETAGVGASALLPDEYEKTTREFIKGAAAAGKKPFEAAPGYEESVGRKLGEGIGSTVPFFALGPAGIAGRIGAGALGVGAGAGEARQAAEAKGATAEERRTATQFGAPVGLLDMLAPNIGPMKNIITTALARGGMEGATEAAQKISQNLIAKGVYDPTQDVLAGSGEEGAYGAGVGALTSLLVDMALGRRARGAKTTEPLATPEQAPAEQKDLLAIGMTPLFKPVDLPDGSVATTREEFDAYQETARRSNGQLPVLSDSLIEGNVVGFPEGGAAATDAQLDAYRQQQQFGENLLAQPADVQGPSFEDMTRAGAQTPAAMAGFTGAPTANVSMMEQVRAAREAEAKAAEKQLKAEIKRIQSGDFNANPIVNQQIKDRMLENLGVTPAQAKSVVAEPVVKEELTPEELALAEAQAPLPGEGVSPNAGMATKDIRKEQKQLQQANLKNVPAPVDADVAAEMSKVKEELKIVNKQIEEAKKQGTDLFNRLKGRVSPDDVFDISPKERGNRLNMLASKSGGQRLSSMVSDGSLNEFLPPDMRITEPGQDESAGVEYIKQALSNGDTRSFDAKVALKALEKQKEELTAMAERPKAERAANLELGALAEEQAGYEGLPTEQLIAQAQQLGIDTEAIAEDVARQTQDMTAEQYHGAARNALISAINTQTGTETLAQAKGEQKGFTATKEDLKTQSELEGKTMIGVAEWAIKNAPNKFSKFVGEKVLARLRALEKQGVTLNFKVESGDRRPTSLYSAQGVTEFVWGVDGNHTVISIALNGAPVMENQAGYPSGLGYDTIMHELLHAATRGQMRFLASTDPLVKELRTLYNTVVNHFNAEVKAGRITPFMERIYKRSNNALRNPDELISWGLTDKEMQDFLNNIKVGEKTVMDKIVQLVRELLGIPKPFETALDRLVRTTDKLLEADVKVLANGMVQEGYTLGRKPGQQSLFSKKAQELFGKEEGKDVTNLPAFKRWFKGSKVVDANGKPLVLYHGTAKDFSKFDVAKLGDNTRDEAGELGFFFTAKPFLSDNYAEIASRGGWAGKTAKGEPVVYPVYVSLQNPKLYKTAADFYRDAEAHKGALNEWRKELQSQGFDGVIVRGDFEEVIAFEPTQIKSVFNKGTFDTSNAEILSKQVGKEKAPEPTGAGVDSMRVMKEIGRGDERVDPSNLQKLNSALKSARDNPKATAEAATAATMSWLDKVETWAFSSDAALNNRIRRAIKEMGIAGKERIGLLLNASLGQTVHSDAVGSLFLQKGNIKYDKELNKWVGEDSDANFVNLSKQLDALAEKNGLTKQQAERIAHTAFEAKRLRSILKFNKELEAKIEAVRAEAAAKKATSPVASSALTKEAARMQQELKYVSPEQKAMIEPAMSLFKIHPELNEVVNTWNKIRENTVKVLVDSGLWSENDAQEMLANADYVPFYREEQLEQNKGPKEFIRGLQVQAREPRFKGSNLQVNDIFDNQVRWVQYSINRAVRNRSAVALADTAVFVGAAKVVSAQEKKGAPNVVRVWKNLPKLDRNGKEIKDENGNPVIENREVFYSMDDPMFVEAFTGLEAIVIPSWKWASELANVLRQSVVMYPMFSVAQVPQDSFAAMFSSGLKPQYALRIPVLAVKEFVQTLRGKSKAHEELKNVGAVGVRDFTSAMVRLDAEIYAGLKAPPGVLGKVKYALNHIAMSADNAVRQAVYDASMSQGLSRAEAMEKAFEVFNVRRKGSSKSLALAGQLIPFFSAYLAAQNVAYKTITGRGISPTERQDAFKTLAATTASVMVLSLLYAMMNGDDEDYLKKPATVRDRLLMVPGTGGFSLPLRADLFTMPKIITEHMYLMMTDKGYEDGRKFRDSMASALGSALLSPTAVPQAIKPLVEVGINYDFFQGRPLVGTYQQKLETERQFTDSTSELGKILGSAGILSPIAIDHLLRGMLGSAGGLIIYATNPILHSDPNTPRPSLSEKDAIAALPGMSGFMMKSYESALKKDFYTLKEEVDKAANTLNDLKKRSPQQIEGFLKDEENLARVGLQKSVNAIGERLSNIRAAITQITNSSMPADQKQQQIEILRKAEEDMLKGVNVKMLRELGKI